MKLKNILIIPLCLSVLLCGFFAYKWYSSSKDVTIETNSQVTNIMQILDKIPAQEISATYSNGVLQAVASMTKSDIETLLDYNSMLNFMTKGVLMLLPDQIEVSFDIVSDELDPEVMIINRIGLSDYSLDVNIRID